MLRMAAAIVIATAVLGMAGVTSLQAQTAEVARGKYLVVLGSCTDCHTPGFFFGKPDNARLLGGSEVGFELPGLGVFHGPNLTPDKETGLGSWTKAQIVAALQTGKRPDGRELAPIMPWRSYSVLSDTDCAAQRSAPARSRSSNLRCASPKNRAASAERCARSIAACWSRA